MEFLFVINIQSSPTYYSFSCMVISLLHFLKVLNLLSTLVDEAYFNVGIFYKKHLPVI